MVSMSDELKRRNILKMLLIARFACATLDVGHPILQFSSKLIAPVEKTFRTRGTIGCATFSKRGGLCQLMAQFKQMNKIPGFAI
jgi:hypothetical protein